MLDGVLIWLDRNNSLFEGVGRDLSSILYFFFWVLDLSFAIMFSFPLLRGSVYHQGYGRFFWYRYEQYIIFELFLYSYI